MFFTLIAILLIIFFSTNIIEKRLKSIDETNKRIVELLEKILNKKT